MKINLQMLALPVAMASFLVGCGGPRITARTDPARPSIVQVQEGYDTFGRRWEDTAAPAAAPSAQPAMLSRNESEVRNFTGTITDIDYPNREITLKDSAGQTETFSVDKEVQRFNEAKAGDKVSVDYYLGFNAEVRKPTAEEDKNRLVVLEATGRAGPDAPPGASDIRQVRAVATIEGLDRINETVTVKGPRGKHYVARVADPSRLDKVHIGDTIVMTFTEAAAISLKPAED
jgi:hypothetical protein